MTKTIIGKYLSETVIREKFGATLRNMSSFDTLRKYLLTEEFGERKTHKFPDIKVEFFDVNSLIKTHNSTIQEMKVWFGPKEAPMKIGPDDPRRDYYFSEQPAGHAVEMVFPPRYARPYLIIG